MEKKVFLPVIKFVDENRDQNVLKNSFENDFPSVYYSITYFTVLQLASTKQSII